MEMDRRKWGHFPPLMSNCKDEEPLRACQKFGHPPATPCSARSTDFSTQLSTALSTPTVDNSAANARDFEVPNSADAGLIPLCSVSLPLRCDASFTCDMSSIRNENLQFMRQCSIVVLSPPSSSKNWILPAFTSGHFFCRNFAINEGWRGCLYIAGCANEAWPETQGTDCAAPRASPAGMGGMADLPSTVQWCPVCAGL